MRSSRCLAWWVVAATLPAAGCREHPTITPRPGVMPSAGMLVRTVRVPLAWTVELRRYELLKSDVSNDFYPHNVARARPADRLTSKLFVRGERGWSFLDFAEMPAAGAYGAANVSSSGDRIVYERPDIVDGEGKWPRAYPRNRRTRRVAIAHLSTGQRFLLDCFTEVYGLGRASFWHPDEQSLALTTTCVKDEPAVRYLVVLDACGLVVLDAAALPGLKDLEFIAWGPDGKRIAALRSRDAREGGRRGGTLFEVDVARRAVREVADVPTTLGCRYVGRYEHLIRWDAHGRCALRKPPATRPGLPSAGN